MRLGDAICNRHDTSRKSKDWRQCKDCRTTVNINDCDLLGKITELLNTVIANSDIIQLSDSQAIKACLDEIYTILDGFKNHLLTYDDQIIRQILECIVVESKEKIKINPPAMPGDCTLIYILSLKNDTVKNIYMTITI